VAAVAEHNEVVAAAGGELADHLGGMAGAQLDVELDPLKSANIRFAFFSGRAGGSLLDKPACLGIRGDPHVISVTSRTSARTFNVE
jgi:hypothetical protein